MTTTWQATWIAGPAAGRTVTLGPGRHLVGRHPRAEVHVRDRAVAPFHAELDLAAGGAVAVTQLAGRAPIGVDALATATGDGSWSWAATDAAVDLVVGSSRLRVHPSADPSTGPADDTATGAGVSAPRGYVVHRRPRALPEWRPEPVRVPNLDRLTRPTPAGLLPAVLALGGAGVLALVLHQPMFLLVGAVGALVALGGWAAQWLGARRGRRADQHVARDALRAFGAALQDQRDARLAHHLSTVGALPAALAALDGLPASAWPRRGGHRDAFTVSIGVGDVAWEPVLTETDPARVPPACWGLVERAGVLHGVEVPVDLGPGCRLALCGPGSDAVARSLLVQLAVQAGPADWQLVVVSERPAAWSWASDLPHLADGSGGPPRLVTPAELACLTRGGTLDHAHTVVVTDALDALAVRTHPLRRLLAADPAPALVAVGAGPFDAPAVSTAVLDVHADGSGRWSPEVARGGLPLTVAVAGLDAGDALDAAGRLAPLRDPEDPRGAGGSLPREVALVDLLTRSGSRLDVAGIAAGWRDHGPDRAAATPLGAAADGVVDVDLVRDGPHALLAGTTGAGKSELLRALVLGLAVRCAPDQLAFVLVDYKGGATFDDLRGVPHVAGIVTDLDDRLAARALRSLSAEIRHREGVLRELGVPDLAAARRATGSPVLPRLVVVVDEFAALAVELPEFLHALVGIAQRGRSLGVHLVLATQRPHGVIGDDIRTNTNLRLALRLPDGAESRDVIGVDDAALLPRDRPGRAVLRLGPDELVTFQTARAPQDPADLVRAIRAAGADDASARRRPWLDPLPVVLHAVPAPAGSPAASRAVASATAIGLVDLPDLPAQVPLEWRPDDGHLLVVGARGSGVSSTLRTATLAALDEHTSFVVVDGIGDRAWDDVAAHPRCAAVVRVSERERLTRLLASAGEHRLLVVDGVAAVRAELDAVERSVEHDLLHRVLDGRADPRLRLLLGNPDTHGLPAALVARCPNRWLLHVPDGRDADVLGRRVAAPAAGCPGRLVLVESPTAAHAGADAQLVHPGCAPDPAAGAGPVARLGLLPTVVRASELAVRRVPSDAAADVPAAPDHDGWHPAVGLHAQDLTIARLVVPDGDHVLVLGPARSGRSCVLARLLDAWRDDRPGAWCAVLAPRRSPLATADLRGACRVTGVAELLAVLPDDGQRLVVVDDADLVDDDGRLAALLAARPAGLVVAAAARPDALRAAYGHWTGAVRRCRRGVLLAACHETDGDLLGVVLPRHGPIAARPGLAHLVEDGALRLVQVAVS